MRRVERTAEQADTKAGDVGEFGKIRRVNPALVSFPAMRNASNGNPQDNVKEGRVIPVRRLASADDTKLYGLTVPSPFHHIFEAGELLHAYGPARMHAARGDADFRAEAEFPAIRELRRGVVQHDGAVHLREEARGGASSAVMIASVW